MDRPLLRTAAKSQNGGGGIVKLTAIPEKTEVPSGMRMAFLSQNVAASGRSEDHRRPKHHLSGSGFRACPLP
jgi:hypothetical protein